MDINTGTGVPLIRFSILHGDIPRCAPTPTCNASRACKPRHVVGRVDACTHACMRVRMRVYLHVRVFVFARRSEKTRAREPARTCVLETADSAIRRT